MQDDIVVKQKPGPQQPVLEVKQPPQAQAVTATQSAEQPQQPNPQTAEKPKVDSKKASVAASQKSDKPIGVIITAVFVALCLVTVALYIGYNQS